MHALVRPGERALSANSRTKPLAQSLHTEYSAQGRHMAMLDYKVLNTKLKKYPIYFCIFSCIRESE